MLVHPKKLFKSRDLLWSWTARNIRARYQQSLLGWFWAIIQPAAQAVIFTIIFTRFVPVDVGDVAYPLFSYTAMVPWTLLALSLTDMTQSLVSNMILLTKIYFPREILPIAALFARLMDFLVAFALLFFLLLYFHVPVFTTSWLFLPVILLVQLLLILGIGFACAAANVFIRDIQSILTLGIQIWFYASPIIYPIHMVPDQVRSIYFLNPMAGIIQAYRDVLLNGEPPGDYFILSSIIAVVGFGLGYWFFKRVENQFADIV